MNGASIREALLVYGLKVWCEKCGARGRWSVPGLRLRQVVCGAPLSDGALCRGSLRAAPRDPETGRAPAHWPRVWIEWRRADAGR